MARLPALVDALAKDDKRGRPAIDHVARVIREAGLVTTTKRGRGAAEMTESDALALLIAINGAETPGNAVDAVKLFSDMPRVDVRRLPFDFPVPPELLTLFRAKTFGQALASILVSLPQMDALVKSSKAKNVLDSRRVAHKTSRPLDLVSIAPKEFRLHAIFLITHASAMIRIEWGHLYTSFYALHLDYSSSGRKIDEKFFRSVSPTRAVNVTIGKQVFQRVHSVLWPESGGRPIHASHTK